MARDQDQLSDYEQLRDALRIDKFNLDDELVNNPELVQRVGEQVEMAISRRDEANLDLKNAMAALDAVLREEAGDKKLTEKAIEQQINDSVKIIDMRKNIIRLTEKVGRWQALRESYRDRSSALKGLCSLHATNYFVVNSGSPYRREAVSRQADDIRAKAGEERASRPARPQASRNKD